MKNEDTFYVNEIRVSLYRRREAGVLHFRFTVDGVRYRDTTKVFSVREARAVARAEVLKALTVRPAPVIPAQTLRQTVTAFLDEMWPEHLRDGNGSYSAAKSRLNSFAVLSGESVMFASLSFDEARVLIQGYIDKRKATLSARPDAGNYASTLNSERLSISRLCSWLMSRQAFGAWQANPAASERIEIPAGVQDDPEPLDDIETDMIVTAAPGVELWPVVVLCLGVGCRPSEAIRAEWSGVDFERHTVSVTNKKAMRARPRYPVMSTWAQTELEAWRADHKDAVTVYPYNRFTAFDQMGRLRESLGLAEHVTLQGLRQTACTRAIASGMKLVDYVQQFGHSLEVARRHYLKFGKMNLSTDARNLTPECSSRCDPNTVREHYGKLMPEEA